MRTPLALWHPYVVAGLLVGLASAPVVISAILRLGLLGQMIAPLCVAGVLHLYSRWFYSTLVILKGHSGSAFPLYAVVQLFLIAMLVVSTFDALGLTPGLLASPSFETAGMVAALCILALMWTASAALCRRERGGHAGLLPSVATFLMAFYLPLFVGHLRARLIRTVNL